MQHPLVGGFLTPLFPAERVICVCQDSGFHFSFVDSHGTVLFFLQVTHFSPHEQIVVQRDFSHPALLCTGIYNLHLEEVELLILVIQQSKA